MPKRFSPEFKQQAVSYAFEPPRDCRRLIFLREYDNENTKLYP